MNPVDRSGSRRNVRRPLPGPHVAPKPAEAEEVLAGLAASYEPTEPLSVGQVCHTARCSRGVALAVMFWARLSGRWPYPPARLRQRGET
jgi:hypothetical protein